MNYTDIETFLELVRTRNITKAAEHLYLSQSTVSNRLMKLENELGFQLIHRQRGHQQIELTSKGEEFIDIAGRWKDLFEETEGMKKNSYKRIHIAVNESSYYILLAPFIQAFSKEYPEYRFDVKICDSELIYERVERGLAHLGFASYESNRIGLVTEEIDRQDLCVITSEECQDPTALDPSREIRFSGGHFSSIDQWREYYYKDVNEPALVINGGFLEIVNLVKDGYWAITPLDMAKYLSKIVPIRVHFMKGQLEPWKVYMTYRKEESSDRAENVKFFMSKFIDYWNLHK